MKEYKFTVEHPFVGTVKDTYTLVAESKEQAIEQFKEIAQSPAEMAILPHDTELDSDKIEYQDAKYSIVYKEDYFPFETSESITLE